MPYKSIEDRNLYQKWYRKKYPEKVKALREKWKEANPDWIKNYHKKYYKEYFKTEKGKEVRRKAGRKQRLGENRDKVLARKRLNYAIEYGHIIKNPCERCGEFKVEGHHPDYTKPLEVIWLCHKCHRAEERKLKVDN
jgi:hypothetical protein